VRDIKIERTNYRQSIDWSIQAQPTFLCFRLCRVGNSFGKSGEEKTTEGNAVGVMCKHSKSPADCNQIFSCKTGEETRKNWESKKSEADC